MLARWVRKEAVLKALGHGLSVDPALLELGPGAVASVTGWLGPGPTPAAVVSDLISEPGYVAAVALLGAAAPTVDAVRSPSIWAERGESLVAEPRAEQVVEVPPGGGLGRHRLERRRGHRAVAVVGRPAAQQLEERVVAELRRRACRVRAPRL